MSRSKTPNAVLHDPLLHVVLVHPEIPQNTGNIGRTCVATGAKLWLVRPLGFRVDAKSLRRAGLDYWQYLDWTVVDSWPDLLQALPERRFWLFTKVASQEYTQVRYGPGDVLVFGSETRGLPESIHKEYPAQRLRIDVRPPVRSLNLSNAVAVGVYEALRQLSVAEGLEG